MQRSNYTIDPIHGRIEIPLWLREIEDEIAVRRMMFIRQLGLKAYIDFPGAIHTRYSHCLGTMHLAGRLANTLSEKLRMSGKTELASILQENKLNLMAAGFLHDIGHGPFSHAVEFAMKTISGKNHEQIAEEILVKKLKQLENHGISIQAVVKLINRRHDYPFLYSVIDSQLDVDKLDYLLRDAYHIGLRYSFDLEHFASNYTVLGDPREPSKCALGLDYSQEAIVTAELFVIIWKSMYDLVYHVEQSRIAEKMLEKAILSCSKDSEVCKIFTDVDRYIEIFDDQLLDLLSKQGDEFSKMVVESIKRKRLYRKIDEPILLNEQEISGKIAPVLEEGDGSRLGEDLTRRLCDELKVNTYDIICDIIKSRIPEDIHIDVFRAHPADVEGPRYLKESSDIIKSIPKRNEVRVYLKPSLTTKVEDKDIIASVKDLLKGW